MFGLAPGIDPGGPTDKPCPSEEPNEAMAERGPMEGRARGELSVANHTRMALHLVLKTSRLLGFAIEAWLSLLEERLDPFTLVWCAHR